MSSPTVPDRPFFIAIISCIWISGSWRCYVIERRYPRGRLAAVEENQTKLPAKDGDADVRLAARLKQILNTPGISDKDRKLVEQNLKRLAAAT